MRKGHLEGRKAEMVERGERKTKRNESEKEKRDEKGYQDVGVERSQKKWY